MALIKCKECGKEISDQAHACPNCGCPVKMNKNKLSTMRKAFGITDMALGGMMLIAVLTSEGGAENNFLALYVSILLLWTGFLGIMSNHRKDFTIGSIVLYSFSILSCLCLSFNAIGYILTAVMQIIFLILVCISLSDKKSFYR